MTSRRKLSPASSKASIRKTIFGPRPILREEDSAAYAAYNELLAPVSAHVKPTGIIDEIWILDLGNHGSRASRLRPCFPELDN